MRVFLLRIFCAPVFKISLAEFKLLPPSDAPEDDRNRLCRRQYRGTGTAPRSCVLWVRASPESALAVGNSAAEMWMLLLIRMITRVAEPPEDLVGSSKE
jgi:symplekin